MRGLTPVDRARRAEAIASLNSNKPPRSKGRPPKEKKEEGDMPPKEVRDYIAKLERRLGKYQSLAFKVAKIQEDLSMAIQADFEGGAAWLSEEMSKEFKKKYPHINKVLNGLADINIPGVE